VARVITDGLIRLRIEHPITECLELERAMIRKFGLTLCCVALNLSEGVDLINAIAPVATSEIERIFSGTEPLVIGLGTGRTLRSSVDEMRALECSQHKVVSLIGNVAPDGSAWFFEMIMRIADKIRAPHVQNTRSLADGADFTIVGIGQLGDDAPLVVDGFVTPEEMTDLSQSGAVGEIVGWAFDAKVAICKTTLIGG
jgi:DNA-binding transcriptional regulator LsrR (DeoR family)